MRRSFLFRPSLLVLACASALVACASTGGTPSQTSAPGADPTRPTAPQSARDQIPAGPLPASVTPTRYALALEVDPRTERFGGEVRIQATLSETQDHIWLHGKNTQVHEAFVAQGDARTEATFLVVDGETGLARLDLARAIPAGAIEIVLRYDAPFERSLEGLYKVENGGESYAFSQFESHFARQCFPGFDEPRFKTPFDLSVTAREGDVVVTTTREIGTETLPEGRARHRFATTAPLPTYLIAFAVGPLDVVDAGPLPPAGVREHPLPFRGVAVKGKGPELAYALAHTRPLLEALEAYFGQPYPFDKLDIIAVPDFASGAMENVGAVTFREVLLLLDEKNAPIEQRKAYASVMAHELAHMWFGNLVTMPWWDDIWLNEAFATWMAAKVTHTVHPEYDADIAFEERVQRAMGSDSLVSARQIRQPIESTHDIRNAFDAITYSKGGGVLAMFERYLGEATFQEGLRRYMDRHRYGSATYSDLLIALSQAAERDVTTPFESFLFQPGLPAVEVTPTCDGERGTLRLRQERHLPLGSTGERQKSWQVPLCVRYGAGARIEEQCTLLRAPAGEMALAACPDWVLPNAAGAGYYRFSMPAAAWDALEQKGRAHLSAAERLSLADSLGGALASGAMAADTVLARVPALAADPHRAVVLAAMGWMSAAHEELASPATRPAVAAFARQHFGPAFERLGLSPTTPDEAGDVRQLRSALLDFLALRMDDAATRSAGARLGRAFLGMGSDGALHPEALEPSLVAPALGAAVREGGAEAFDALLTHLERSDNALLRSQLIGALSRSVEPALAARARALTLDPRLRGNERLIPLYTQAQQPATREDTWVFVTQHFDALREALPHTHLGALPGLGGSFCSEADAARVEAFFAPRIETLPGGPRNLKAVVESVGLCAARVAAQREATDRFFARPQ